jgi:hypothetical protein
VLKGWNYQKQQQDPGLIKQKNNGQIKHPEKVRKIHLIQLEWVR